MTKELAEKEAQRRANILQDNFMVLRTKDGDYVVASKFRVGTSHVQTFHPLATKQRYHDRSKDFMRGDC